MELDGTIIAEDPGGSTVVVMHPELGIPVPVYVPHGATVEDVLAQRAEDGDPGFFDFEFPSLPQLPDLPELPPLPQLPDVDALQRDALIAAIYQMGELLGLPLEVVQDLIEQSGQTRDGLLDLFGALVEVFITGADSFKVAFPAIFAIGGATLLALVLGVPLLVGGGALLAFGGSTKLAAIVAQMSKGFS